MENKQVFTFCGYRCFGDFASEFDCVSELICLFGQ